MAYGLVKKETIRKVALLGLGIAAISREKARALAEELARTQKINEKEGRALVNSIVKKAEASKKELEEKVRREMQSAIRTSRLVSAREVDVLEKKIDMLEKRLAALSKKKRR